MNVKVFISKQTENLDPQMAKLAVSLSDTARYGELQGFAVLENTSKCIVAIYKKGNEYHSWNIHPLRKKMQHTHNVDGKNIRESLTSSMKALKRLLDIL